MTTVSESIEQPVVAVSPRVDRARRISRLAGSTPVIAILGTWLCFENAQHVFGEWAPWQSNGLWISLGVAVLMTIVRNRDLASRSQVRLRSTRRDVRGALPALGVTVALVVASALRSPPLSAALIVLLLVPVLVWAVADWWRKRWWPRFTLMVACGLAVALLPLPEKADAAIRMFFFGFAALSNLIDQCELYKLLGAAAREAGDPAA